MRRKSYKAKKVIWVLLIIFFIVALIILVKTNNEIKPKQSKVAELQAQYNSQNEKVNNLKNELTQFASTGIMKDNKTYSINEIAKTMKMTLKVVRRYVASGELKTSKNNNTYSISEEDFEAFKKYIEDGGDTKHAQEVADTFIVKEQHSKKDIKKDEVNNDSNGIRKDYKNFSYR